MNGLISITNMNTDRSFIILYDGSLKEFDQCGEDYKSITGGCVKDYIELYGTRLTPRKLAFSKEVLDSCVVSKTNNIREMKVIIKELNQQHLLKHFI